MDITTLSPLVNALDSLHASITKVLASPWTIEPGQLSTGPAWYYHATVNGHRLSIIERPSIDYCRWYGSTDTEVIEDQPAASLDAAKSAAEAWAWGQ